MSQTGHGPYLGLLAFLSFAFSVIAAVIAIDMYALLRTGRLGKSWRVLIIASVMFALLQVLRMVEYLQWSALSGFQLSEVVELMFVMALAYALFLQRRVFAEAADAAKASSVSVPDDADEMGAPVEQSTPEFDHEVAERRTTRSWGAHARPRPSGSLDDRGG